MTVTAPSAMALPDAVLPAGEPRSRRLLQWNRRSTTLIAVLVAMILLFGLVAAATMTRSWHSVFPKDDAPRSVLARLGIHDVMPLQRARMATAVGETADAIADRISAAAAADIGLHALSLVLAQPLAPLQAPLGAVDDDDIHAAARWVERRLWLSWAELDGYTLRHEVDGTGAEVSRMLQGLWWAYGAFMAGSVVLIAMLMTVQRRSYAALEATEQSRAELQHARNQLGDAVNAIGDGFLLLDRDMNIVMANQRFRQLYGRVADRLRHGAPVEDLIRAGVERGTVNFPETAAQEVAFAMEHLRHPLAPYERQLSDGRWLRIHSRTTADGGTVSLHTDITEAKRSEMRLRQRVAGIDAAMDGIALADADGRFLYANPSLAQMHGYRSPVMLVGQNWSILFSPDMRGTVESEVMPQLAGASRWSGETRGRRRDGNEFPMDLALSRLADGSTLWIVRDITDRRHMEDERSQLQRQFYQSQKMEAMGRLAGGIAHDFNNILASMLGYAALLEEDLPEGSTSAQFARRIVSGAERAKALVKQILVFSRSQDTERRAIDLASVVRETAGLLTPTLPRQVKLELDLAEALPPVNGDATQLVQVVMNLCVNAADAMGLPGGALQVKADVTTVDGGCTDGLARMGSLGDRSQTVRIQSDRRTDTTDLWLGLLPAPGAYVCLTVADCGTGIPADVVERMFEPFYTTKEVGKGTGLGLAAVHGIVMRHQGALHLSTRLGQGTTFRIYLPPVDNPMAAQLTPAG